ncbi:MAG: hypothetical protein Q4A36_01175 [Candidatus Saccharibacteria bacterium]|nr:hypothetical protein [Candidatus Saccharibacteria bacterium]
MRRIFHRVRCITWSCPRCGRPFTSEMQRDLHMLSCGSSKFPWLSAWRVN